MMAQLLPASEQMLLQNSQMDFATIRARQQQHIRRVHILAPALCRIIQGHKIVHWQQQALKVTPNDLLLFPAGAVVNIENHPEQQLYNAEIVSFPLPLIHQYQLMRQAHAGTLQPSAPVITSLSMPMTPELDFCWQTLTHSIQQPLSWPMQQHFAQGLLLALEGSVLLENLLVIEQHQLRHKLQQLFLRQCGLDWKLADAAHWLHLGESTIRRKLAEEGSSFRQVLDEVRFTVALGMVQTTDLPISRVAEHCGYESASRFSVKFKSMYGISPSELRIK